MNKKIMALVLLVLFYGLPYPVFAQATDPSIEFVDIPGNGKDVQPFKMAKTEVTNQQNPYLVNKNYIISKYKPSSSFCIFNSFISISSSLALLVFFKVSTSSSGLYPTLYSLSQSSNKEA